MQVIKIDEKLESRKLYEEQQGNRPGLKFDRAEYLLSLLSLPPAKVDAHNLPQGTCHNWQEMKVMSPPNGVFQGLYKAFDRHRAYVLTPDTVWAALTRAFVNYQRLPGNADKLRGVFRIDWQGQKEVHIVNNEVRRKDPNIDIKPFVGQFTAAVGEVLPELSRALTLEFTTSTVLDKLINSITVLAGASSYVSLTMHTCCGLPEVRMMGTAVDWETLKQRGRALLEYMPPCPWRAKTLNLLSELSSSAQGNWDPEWWKGLFNENGMSGGPFFDGHFRLLFPPADVTKFPEGKYSCTIEGIPAFTVDVPFTWDYYGTKYAYGLTAGYTCFTEHSDGALEPTPHWVLHER